MVETTKEKKVVTLDVAPEVGGQTAPKGPVRELVRNVTDPVDGQVRRTARCLTSSRSTRSIGAPRRHEKDGGDSLGSDSDGAGKHRIGTPVRDLVKKVLGGGDDDEKSGPPKADDDPE